MIHTLSHALAPADSDCRCDMKDITHCVICEKRLDSPRTHVDTCGEICYRSLLRRRREV